MNTITYLTSLFNPSSRPSNSNSLTTPQPTQDHQGPSGRLDALGGDTIYLSARRGREGEGPQIRVSLESPAHLVGLLPPPPYGAAGGESTAGVDPIAEEDGESGPGSEGEGMGGGEKEGSDVYVSKREVEAEDLEGERKLLLRRDVKVWPVRVGVEIYIFLRHLLTLVGLLHPSLRDDDLVTPISSPATTHDGDDVPSTPPTPITKPRLSFFLRRPSPPHPHPSPPPSTASTAPSRGPRRMSPKTLVLDLDETLIHSTSRPQAGRSNGLKVRVVEVVLEGRSTIYTVYKRPWVDFFLRKVSTWYTVIIFTASLPEYADPVIDWLDGGDGGGGMVGGRLFRSDCLHMNGAYMKDLSVVDADLSKVCLVDNSPASYAINQANGIPIEGWINDPNDECLLDLLPMLDSLRFTSDVRRVLGLRGFGK